MKYLFQYTGNELANQLNDQVESFQQYVIQTGLFYQWYQNKRFYENRFMSGYIAGADILDIGEQGELKGANINHFRNILRHIINQATAQIPSFTVSAENSDLASRRAARIGKDIVNYYFKVRRFLNQLHQACEYAVCYGDGFCSLQWDPTLGQPYAASGGVQYKQGDFQISAHSPVDVFYDISCKTKADWNWVLFRRRKNKFDLAAAFPQFKETIEAIDPFYVQDKYITLDPQSTNLFGYYNQSEIYLYSAYHKPTESLPNGKYCLYCGNPGRIITLYEGDNIYGKLPIFSISPSQYLENAFGFTEANCLRVPQEMYGIAFSSQLTNLSAFGVANLWSRDNIDVQQVTDGMNLLKTDEKPEVLNLFQDNPSILGVMTQCEKTMETLSGQNAVVRGNIQDAPNLKSGIAISLVQASAQAYNQALEQTVFETYEDIANFILDTLKKVATTERMVEVLGKSRAAAIKTYKSDDLKGAGRVSVERVNPIAKTPAGRAEIGMEFLKNGVFGQGPSSAQKLLEFVNTGNLDLATESEDTFLDFVQDVKEQLMQGKQVMPIPGINHQFFIKEIHSIILDTDILANRADIVQNVTNLINGQMNYLRNGDEIANLVYGNQPPVPPQIGMNETSGLLPGIPEQTLRPGIPVNIKSAGIPPVEQIPPQKVNQQVPLNVA